MTSPERVFTALRRRPPDRVPILEFVVDKKVSRAVAPGCRDADDCMDRLDLDGVGCGAQFQRVRTFPDGSFEDEWGVLYQENTEAVAHPLRGTAGNAESIHEQESRETSASAA
jgi:hypothetical protein